MKAKIDIALEMLIARREVLEGIVTQAQQKLADATARLDENERSIASVKKAKEVKSAK